MCIRDSNKTVQEFQKIAPFGADNIEPLIAIRNVRIINFRTVGKEGKHFSFVATDESGDRLNCIAFNIAGSPIGDAIKTSSNGPLIHIIGFLRENSFNNRPQLQIVDCFLVN